MLAEEAAPLLFWKGEGDQNINIDSFYCVYDDEKSHVVVKSICF